VWDYTPKRRTVKGRLRRSWKEDPDHVTGIKVRKVRK
jgi:hypothetical protein